MNEKVGQFDQVRILTVKNVQYLSAPPGTALSPSGVWSVAAIVAGNELLLVQNNVTIRIPADDVLKVADYSLVDVLMPLGNLSKM